MEGNTVAKIALQSATYAIDKPYDYQVPPELLDTLRPGMRVVVPFGAGNRRTEGIVLALEGGYPDDPRRKSILTVLDEEPVLDGEALRLAEQEGVTVFARDCAVSSDSMILRCPVPVYPGGAPGETTGGPPA